MLLFTQAAARDFNVKCFTNQRMEGRGDEGLGHGVWRTAEVNSLKADRLIWAVAPVQICTGVLTWFYIIIMVYFWFIYAFPLQHVWPITSSDHLKPNYETFNMQMSACMWVYVCICVFLVLAWFSRSLVSTKLEAPPNFWNESHVFSITLLDFKLLQIK